MRTSHLSKNGLEKHLSWRRLTSPHVISIISQDSEFWIKKYIEQKRKKYVHN